MSAQTSVVPHLPASRLALRDQLAERLESAVAPSTRAAYRRGWGQFSAWASAHGFAVRPATPEASGPTPTSSHDPAASHPRSGSPRSHRSRTPGRRPRIADYRRVRRTVQAIERNHRDDGGTVKQSAGITADVLARIEATAHRPRKRGRGIESDASAAARARLDVAIVRVMRDTLARVSEAASMTWGQIERQPDGVGTIAFRRPKTDSDTTAYLSPSTIAALDAIRPADAGQDTTLFGLKPAMLKRRIKAACKAAGIDGASSHGCRVGMAQDLARTAGVDMPAIMQAGGWRTEKMVARYTAREQAARGAVARFYETA